MIDALILNRSKEELNSIHSYVWQLAARLSEDEWSWHLYSDSEKMSDFMKNSPLIDFACLDITCSSGISLAEKVRAESHNSLIMLVSDPAISPMLYLKPSIMPGALLLRPFTAQQMEQTTREILKKLLDEKTVGEDKGSFQLQLKSERKILPYSQIYYFEAREKKIFINTGNQEFCCNDTIDRLQEELPPMFVRCHRSFIVAKPKIDKIYISKNYMELDNGVVVPLSRTYKSVLKELK